MKLTAPAQALSSGMFWVGIAELYNLIANARPRNPAGAAVLLRPALAAIEAHDFPSPWRELERVEGRLVAVAAAILSLAPKTLAPRRPVANNHRPRFGLAAKEERRQWQDSTAR